MARTAHSFQPLPAQHSRRLYVGFNQAQRRRIKLQGLALLLLTSVGVALVPLVRWMSGSTRYDLTVVLTVLVPVVLLLLIPYARRLKERQRLAALAEAGLICANCAYSMQGLDDSVARCPECGQARDVQTIASPGETSASTN